MDNLNAVSEFSCVTKAQTKHKRNLFEFVLLAVEQGGEKSDPHKERAAIYAKEDADKLV